MILCSLSRVLEISGVQILDVHVKHALLVETAPALLERAQEWLLLGVNSHVSKEFGDASENFAAAG